MVSYYTHVNNLLVALEIGNQNYKDCVKQEYTDELLMTLSFLITIHLILGNPKYTLTFAKNISYKLDDIKSDAIYILLLLCNTITLAILKKCIAENEQALKYATILNDNYTYYHLQQLRLSNFKEKTQTKLKKCWMMA